MRLAHQNVTCTYRSAHIIPSWQGSKANLLRRILSKFDGKHGLLTMELGLGVSPWGPADSIV